VDVRPVMQDLDLINAVQLALPGQVEQVADGIVRSFRTDLSRDGILAMLILLFDWPQDLGNFLRENPPRFPRGKHC